MDVSLTVEDVVSAEVEGVDITMSADPVVVHGMSDEADYVCSDEVS